MDLVTDKCIEDKTELNYYVEETNTTEWEIQNYTTYREKVADGIKKIPKHRKKINHLKQMGTDVLLIYFLTTKVHTHR